MKNYLTLILPLSFLLLTGCAKNESLDDKAFKSQLTVEFADKILSFEEENNSHFAVTLGSKTRLYDLDSAIIVMVKGLGENQSLSDPLINTLYVSFTERHTGFHIVQTDLEAWLTNGERNFVRDGAEGEGIGILWFDEQGEMWASGKNIGEFKYQREIIADSVFPAATDFQKDSKFSILSSKTVLPPPGLDFAEQVKMEFNTTLYNASGDSLVIKKAVFETVFSVFRY